MGGSSWQTIDKRKARGPEASRGGGGGSFIRPQPRTMGQRTSEEQAVYTRLLENILLEQKMDQDNVLFRLVLWLWFVSSVVHLSDSLALKFFFNDTCILFVKPPHLNDYMPYWGETRSFKKNIYNKISRQAQAKLLRRVWVLQRKLEQ